MKVNLGHSFRHIGQQSGADITGIKLIPPHDHLGEKIGPLLPSGFPNAEVLKSLMKKAHEILDRHPLNEKRRAEGKMPANGVWFWAEGTAVKLPNFVEENGYDGAVVSAVPLCHGIAALAGLDMVCPEGATGEIDTNYENKLAAALEKPGVNTLPLWQDYALGIDPTNSVAPVTKPAGDTDPENITLAIPAIDTTKYSKDYDISYQVMKDTASDPVKTVPDPSAILIPLSNGTGTYMIKAVFTPAN